jgi:outer membrane protein assembly factor BamA
MRPFTAALLLAAATPALAWGQTYTLDKISIVGNKQVPTSSLDAAVTEKPGTKVTKDDILADQDNILAVYKKANVGTAITVLLATKEKQHAEVTFKLDEKSAPPPQTVTLQNKLAHMTFVGNVAETTDTLVAAAAIKPGDLVTNDVLKAVQQRLVDVYKNDHKANVSVNIEGDIATPASTPGQVDVTWRLTETKAKKKPRNTDDPGGMNAE